MGGINKYTTSDEHDQVELSASLYAPPTNDGGNNDIYVYSFLFNKDQFQFTDVVFEDNLLTISIKGNWEKRVFEKILLELLK